MLRKLLQDWRRKGLSNLEQMIAILRDKQLRLEYKQLSPDANLENWSKILELLIGLSQQGKSKQEASERSVSMEKLLYAGEEYLNPIVIEVLLHDPSAVVREDAAHYLGTYGSEKLIPYLRQQLAVETDPYVNIALVDAISYINGSESYVALKEALNNRSVAVKIKAVKALAQYKGSEVVSVLLGLLLEDSNEVKIAALEALMKIGDKKAISALKWALSNLRGRSNKTVKRSFEETLDYLQNL